MMIQIKDHEVKEVLNEISPTPRSQNEIVEGVEILGSKMTVYERDIEVGKITYNVDRGEYAFSTPCLEHPLHGSAEFIKDIVKSVFPNATIRKV